MEDEAALRLHRSAGMDRNVRGGSRSDSELAEQIVEADPRHDPAEADAEGSILVVDAHRDHRLFEARVADPRHGEEKLAGKERRLVHRGKL
jgi:hypothetical protein